jgi:hypothetical protein
LLETEVLWRLWRKLKVGAGEGCGVVCGFGAAPAGIESLSIVEAWFLKFGNAV